FFGGRDNELAVVKSVSHRSGINVVRQLKAATEVPVDVSGRARGARIVLVLEVDVEDAPDHLDLRILGLEVLRLEVD
ncbi:hypothetical protein PENTCL1PPCAC_14852, partial [Pristionchus entomophagus]